MDRLSRYWLTKRKRGKCSAWIRIYRKEGRPLEDEQEKGVKRSRPIPVASTSMDREISDGIIAVFHHRNPSYFFLIT